MSTQQQVQETPQQTIARLLAENEALRNKKPAVGGMKVSAKGAVSVYGLGRFPITLYMSQWETLLGKGDDIKAFILANAAQLKTKGE